MKLDREKQVNIDYTNWRNERSIRSIQPIEIIFTHNEWHPEPQWLLRAWDIEKDAERLFALKHIHTWQVS